MEKRDALRYRIAPLEMTPSEFRKVGRQLVERIADFLCTLPDRPVVPNESPQVIRETLGTGSLPEEGAEAKDLLEEAADLLFEHSTYNGHPRFWGVITSSAAPIGALGDLLTAAVNPNVGGWLGAPMTTEIEAQTVRWIAELIGYPTDCGGLLGCPQGQSHLGRARSRFAGPRGPPPARLHLQRDAHLDSQCGGYVWPRDRGHSLDSG